MRSRARFAASILIATAVAVRLAGAEPPGVRRSEVPVLIQDDRRIWRDSDSISRDGYLYISTSQVQMAPPFNGGVDQHTLPYGLFRLEIE